ncbi:hypothetical protein ANI_1_2848024 [Paecilomyces variotii No. 5]|uniref:DUF1168 domain protein n=1 Tax=Byssochlamys spectabilis (strain No. 5 / NBRC 109023) TaxID=1356009 RepID=V5FGF8_BYSSN|nr:hypothetical protein ANI_1_2848024 [Paecilomyces variotii No. 5]
MSESIPESVPTSADPRSKRPLKRRALTPVSEQATQIESLFKDPTKDIQIPPPKREKTSAALPPPPEIVANVQGSSAGAGSGEFHVYKASRRREYERIQMMEQEVRKEKADEEFEKKREEQRRKDAEKTEKNRKKREKRKAGKNKKGSASNGDVEMKVDGPNGAAGGPTGGSKGVRQEDVQAAPDGTEARDHEEPGVIIHDDD